MKQYTKLPIPKDSAWDRKTWRRYAPIWLKHFIDGCQNIIDWLPIIWEDKHWDDCYTTKIIQRKIELQRNYIVKHNRHTRVDEDNYWMTVTLNLIEREHEEYYTLEKYDYKKSDIKFINSKTHPGSYEMKEEVKWEDLDTYIAKYPAAARRVMKLYPGRDFVNKETLSLYIGIYNQERCRNLLFEILKRYSNRWWD